MIWNHFPRFGHILTLIVHSCVNTLVVSDGKCCFIKLWSSLELFGFEFLSCSEAKSNQKGLIGISKDKVRFQKCGVLSTKLHMC